MACGTPVVTVPSGCYADAAVDRETGVLLRSGRPVVLARQLRGLLVDPMLIQDYARAAAEFAVTRPTSYRHLPATHRCDRSISGTAASLEDLWPRQPC